MVKITIGILTVPLSKNEYYVYKNNKNVYFNSYLPNSYVKWLEQSGAKVVPIPFNLPEKKLLSVSFPNNIISVTDNKDGSQTILLY